MWMALPGRVDRGRHRSGAGRGVVRAGLLRQHVVSVQIGRRMPPAEGGFLLLQMAYPAWITLKTPTTE
jgi:hypothetical protein